VVHQGGGVGALAGSYKLMSQTANLPPLGYQDPTSTGGAKNGLDFLVRQILAEVNTVTLLKVTAVTSAGGLAPAGLLTAQPLVNQLDGYGNSEPHGPLYGLMYFRLQGGSNAIIMDPAVGDTGIGAFASRDISSVKAPIQSRSITRTRPAGRSAR